MSKSTDQVLLVPGETGWEIWTHQSEGGFTLHAETEAASASDLESIPGGELTMLFPVRSFTAVPMRVASDDDSLFPDLATLHAERLGLRPDPMAGQLTDVFVVAREQENTALLSLFLRAPADGELPKRGPKGFDVSPRAFPAQGDCVTLWKEFGRWVFAIHHQGKLVYCQATADDSRSPGDALAREIRFSSVQLSMQGLELSPSRIWVWSSAEGLDPAALVTAFRVPVEVKPKPFPVLPEPLSKLLPADVRAARRAARKKRNILLGAAALVALYLGGIGWFAFGIWQKTNRAEKITKQADALAPDRAAYEEHQIRWDELAHAVDLTHSPLDILYRISQCIPPNSGLRLRNADISATSIKLVGEAQQLQAVNSFSLKLTKSNELANFVWQTPEPQQSKRGWEFVYSAEVPVAQTQP